MIFKKLKKNKWLTLCLFLGITFLVSAFSCFPMFESGSIDLMLKNEFETQMEKTNKHPMILTQEKKFNVEEVTSIEDIFGKTSGYKSIWEKYLEGVNPIISQRMVCFQAVPMKTTLKGRGGSIDICCTPELTDHIKMVGGADYYSEENVHTCVMSTTVMDFLKANIGEDVNFFNVKDKDKNMLKLKITGVFDAADSEDLFWNEGPNEFDSRIYVSPECFNDIIQNYDLYSMLYSESELFDFYNVNNQNVEDVIYCVETIDGQDEGFSYNFKNIISNYRAGKKTISISIWVLQIPMLGMVLAFIFMVSKQILEAEKNEMAMLYSRGVKRWQIIYKYTVQSFVIAIFAYIAGIPLGYGTCKLAAGAKNFLVFSAANIDIYRFCMPMLIFGTVASLVALIVIVIPVFKYSKVTIVEHKKEYGFTKKMIWEKFFLDIALLAVASYLLRNYYTGIETVRANALTGAKMDPMIFMDVVLFMIAGGLVALRLSHYLVKIIYAIGKKKWKPAKYASFLQINREFRKQCFISVFLTLTIAMGIFYANASRTINGNYAERLQYELGADLVSMEKWTADLYRDNGASVNYEYNEPDYPTYTKLVDDGICDNVTRVIVSDKTFAMKERQTVENCQLMGIVTDEFGKTATFKDEWGKGKHWYNYLNELAKKSNTTIISSNLAKSLNVKVGDKITCYRLGELADQKDTERGRISLKVCAIVDSWPGYNRYYYEEGELKERSLIVMNYATVVDTFKISPYEVWMDLAEDKTYDDVYSYLDESGVEFKYRSSYQERVEELQYNYLLQITNGLFTLSFVIALVLCTIGFLIYWISSISKRQLLFGVYRAMGLSVEEINGMLINEHIFSTFMSVLSGAGVGVLASALFTKIFAIIFLPKKHNIDIKIIYNTADYVKLGTIIVLMIAICLLCLRNLVKKMDISKSLKLGED